MCKNGNIFASATIKLERVISGLWPILPGKTLHILATGHLYVKLIRLFKQLNGATGATII